ncbi:MAG: HEAT repeat domain-containing protein [Lewinellaceae bacterium]|nr:HEAT repeat domain-containing protein [Lewinellaceae bacterium]
MKIHSILLKYRLRLTRLQLSKVFTWTPIFTLLLLLADPGRISAQQPDSLQKMPPAHDIRPQTMDIQHIALDLRFDWAKKQAYGLATIRLSPLKAMDKITLDAGFLTINSVKTANGTPLKFEYDGGDQNDGLKIRLDRKYAPGETLAVQIDYRTNYLNESDPNNLWGSYGKGIRFFAPTSTEPRKRRQIWSMGEPESNRYWFPGYDAPQDFRSTEFSATVDKKLTVLSNGHLVGTKENADGTHTFHWKMDRPHANHQTSFVVGEYLDFFQKYEDVALHSWGYPDEMEAVQATVVRLPEMVRFFSEITGFKYPYPAYNQVFVQDFPWGGGHNIGLSTMSENMIDDFGTHSDFFYLWDGVEAQDLAAQWFGNLLTPRDWEHAWLSKSFALYFDCLFTEYKNGPAEMLLWNRQFQHSTYLADWHAGIRRPIVTRHYDSPQTMTQDNYALRGAMVLHLLRKHLGEGNWRKAIRGYVKSHAHQSVTTEDFQGAVEAATGEKLDWFFDQWLYKMGHPVFEVTKNYDPGQKQLSLTVRQIQKMDPNNEYPQVEFFQGKMDIEIDGRIEHIWLAPKSENVFVFAAPKSPALVNFDVENTWIKEVKFEKSLVELLYQFQNDRDVLGRRSAMFELANIFKNEKTTADDKANIQAAFRQVILGDSYWRLRYSALLTLQNLTTSQPLDEATIAMLLTVMEKEKSWNRAAAIGFLGMSKDAKYAGLYRQYFQDESDRVVNAAANALGKSKSPEALEALLQLKDKPSWKNQSLISALNGLKELGDPRGADLALTALQDADAAPRWTLATSTWDFRLAAAETLVTLGKGSAGYPIVYERFVKSMAENDVHDIFSNVLLLTTLADPRGQAIFAPLKVRFKDDANALKAVEQYENQLQAGMK